MKRVFKKLVAASLGVGLSAGASAENVSYSFTVDPGFTGAAVLQVGMYAQHGNGTTASGIWDNVSLTGPATFSDNFDDRGLTDATIGNNWTWFDTNWDTTDCSGASVGGYGPWSDGDGNSDYVHPNNNYARHGDNGGEYFRAGLEDTGSGLALNVYHNQYAVSPCNEIKIFQEIRGDAAALSGAYTFTATVTENQYTAIEAGNQVGVFFKVLNEGDGSYAEAQYERQRVLAPSVAPPVVGDPDAIPALPLGGLFGLIGLVAWLGLRRKV